MKKLDIDEEEGKPVKSKKKKVMAQGKKPKMRADKSNRYADGGKIKGKGKTQINIIVGKDGQPQPVPVPVPASGPPPMAAKPPMPPQGVPPQGMPPRPPMKKGGVC